jgi:hypothetical protein
VEEGSDVTEVRSAALLNLACCLWLRLFVLCVACCVASMEPTNPTPRPAPAVSYPSGFSLAQLARLKSRPRVLALR